MAKSEDNGHYLHESSPQEGADSFGAESSQEDDEGLFIPSYLEEALPDDPTLQVKMARAMRAQEVETRRCFTCNQPSLTEAERQDLLLEKLDLTGLEAWPEDQVEKAHSLLKEYHDIFSLEKCDVGHTKAA